MRFACSCATIRAEYSMHLHSRLCDSDGVTGTRSIQYLCMFFTLGNLSPYVRSTTYVILNEISI